MALYRLIYVSQAIAGLEYPDLVNILEKSEQNNRTVGITGMLSFGDGMFLQVLEGSRRVVSQTYNRILLDKRHVNAELIEFSEIEQRDFGIWSMKVVQMDSQPQIRNIILKYSSSETFSPISMTGRQSLSFLRELTELYQKGSISNN
ncbi:BLUF domain-containing protein [Pseudanabaena sp. ABRG5-3]|uniref:BLUF domain-containing protein n=1 Tax=Pseudanabaena sp. ABRG5-3 TaxID=685565 RepID=UPI000DC72616|nr:BLUF domain-containing protein [Pseudanabaena sp. ABRG5-3]BBC25283.1 BLUF domain protein [Pseudanabaena sp. ABRG5-3]